MNLLYGYAGKGLIMFQIETWVESGSGYFHLLEVSRTIREDAAKERWKELQNNLTTKIDFFDLPSDLRDVVRSADGFRDFYFVVGLSFDRCYILREVRS